jgi:hypothetical protein
MLSNINQEQLLLGLLDKKFASFNIRRSPKSYSSLPQKVILLSVPYFKKTIIPGIKEKGEPLLKKDVLDFVREK